VNEPKQRTRPEVHSGAIEAADCSFTQQIVEESGCDGTSTHAVASPDS